MRAVECDQDMTAETAQRIEKSHRLPAHQRLSRRVDKNRMGSIGSSMARVMLTPKERNLSVIMIPAGVAYAFRSLGISRFAGPAYDNDAWARCGHHFVAAMGKHSGVPSLG
jgi:hypothetical protein